MVHVEAHDSLHGWAPERIEVSLDEDKGDRFAVVR